MKKFLPILTLLALVCATPRAHAIGIRLWPQDPEAVSRGSAFAATADNPSAIYYNPAGITQLEGQQFSLSSYAIIYDVKFDSQRGAGTTSTPDKLQATGQFYYTFSLKNLPISLGLGVYEPYGLKSTWRDSGPFRTIATKNSLIYVTINPVIAWKINNQLSVAAGVRVEPAHIDLRRGILVPGDEFKFTGDGTAVGFNAGVLWKPHRMHSIGVNYFSETSINFDGQAEVNSQTPFFFPSSKEDAKFKFDFPQHVDLGYSFRPTEDWNFEFDLDWTDWHRVGVTTLHKQSGDLVLPFNWRSGFTYQFGIKRKLGEHWSASAGYIYAPKNTPNETYTPAIPDMDLHTYSIGTVYERNAWSIALTYQFGYGTREVSGSPTSLIGQTADGKYRWISNAIMLGAGVKF